MTARRPARVLVLIDTLAAGGAERLAVELVRGLDRSRFDPHVLVTKRGGPLEALLQGDGIRCTILGRRRRTSPRGALRALRLARGSDLIHSHLFGNNVWGALLAATANVPLVAHEHNRTGRHGRAERLLDRFLIGPRADRILCVSQPAAHRLRAGGIPAGKIELLPNGVRLDGALSRDAARRRLGLSPWDVVIGSVATLRPEKAHDLLLRAFATLVARQGGRLRLCLVGDGTERDRLRARAHDLGLDGRVAWAGERSDAPLLGAAFDVAVVCSHEEGLPLAALEALAAGTPLVATRVGALPELLAGGAGVLVDAGDEDGLASAIGRVLADEAFARSLAASGRLRVALEHDLAAVTRRLEAVYDEALAARSRRLPEFEGRPDEEEEVSVKRVARVG